MKEIPLAKELVALVDDADYEYLNCRKWGVAKTGNVFYAKRTIKTLNGKETTVFMHIEIIGKKEGYETDHINGNGLDNQRHNLQHVTHRQNLQNIHTKTSSKYPGVSWYKTTSKWRACIWIADKLKHLGYFTDELAAFHAYNKAVNELGEIIIKGGESKCI